MDHQKQVGLGLAQKNKTTQSNTPVFIKTKTKAGKLDVKPSLVYKMGQALKNLFLLPPLVQLKISLDPLTF